MLKLDKLSLQLGGNKFHFTLQADTSRVSAVLGKSGSGKSTLLNLIAGFLKPDSGELYWQEHSLLNFSASARPVTSLFQQHNLFSHLTVQQNIGLGVNPNLKLNSTDLDNIDEVLREVGLEDFSTQRADTLSGGEQQRVALARCLLRNQPILLLDEPFSALDEATRFDMLELTSKVIKNHQLCVVLVTHNTDDAIFLEAQQYDLEGGRLIPR
ncbi:MAG: ATP-binding cassette domain-containing protein [Gammaproteobacteria bacterium]|nr:ATP-binding cassette domain-containing protein [Gammaproteobacteria bacterium]